MSISTLTNNYAATLPQSQAQSASSGARPSNGSAGTAPSAPSATSQTSAPESSAQVTLSPDAQAIAKLNSEGITMTETSLAGLKLPSHSSNESAIEYGQQIAQALQGFAPVTPPTAQDGKTDGYISQSAVESVVAQFGGSKTEADQLFTALDGGDGSSISNAEMLGAMADTVTAPNSSTTQALLKLADSNGDGTVNSGEFMKFETALVAAETPAS